MTVLAATRDGLFMQEEAQSWRRCGLAGLEVTSVIAREGVILAGTRQGVWRSDDRGENWAAASAGLTSRHVRWLAFHPDVSDLEMAGTEPAGIFLSHDGAQTWRAAPEVPRLRDAHGWFLPYSPEAGCVRGFAVHGRRLYAAVEVGGVLVSDDRGQTWKLADGSDGRPRFSVPAPGMVHPDVHSIEAHPSSPDRVLAVTGGGLFRSEDGGGEWRCLYACYCRAAWWDPRDADHIIFGPADNVDRGGRIEETRDGGRTWRKADVNMHTPWPRHMVERLAVVGPELYAVLSNGELWRAPRAGLIWQPTDLPGRAAAVWGMADE